MAEQVKELRFSSQGIKTGIVDVWVFPLRGITVKALIGWKPINDRMATAWFGKVTKIYMTC